MPSARTTATPLRLSSGSFGMTAPWKSWLFSFRPLSECCPIETLSSRAIAGSRGSATALPRLEQSRDRALRRRLHVRRIERQPGEGEAADEVADHGRDL